MIDRSARRLRTILALVATVLSVLWGAFLAREHLAGRASVLNRIEGPASDLLFVLTGQREPPGRVVIVAIDDETIRQAGSYPLPRSALARIVDGLDRHGPSVVGLDFLFLDPGPAPEDAALVAALRATRSVVAGAGLFGDGRGALNSGSGALSDIPVADRFLWPIEPIRRVSGIGFVNVSLDQAGTPRYVPLVMRADDGLVGSFALAVAGAAAGAPVLEAGTLLLGGRAIDTDLGQNMPLRFYGPRETFRTISAADILRGRVPDEAIRDHIVIVGATAAGVGDTFSTPFDPILPGVELLATAVGNLLEGHGLVRTLETRRIDAAAAILLPLLAILLMSLQRVGIGLALTALLVAVWAAVTTIAFSRGYWLSAALPIAALSVPGALYAFSRMVLLRATERSLAVTQRTMRLFHPPVLADRLATSPDYLSQPVQQDVAVLFVDLNGFTAMSERIGPSQTRDRLKILHTIIDETVERHGGVTLNYMGDGAMIVFGLPETQVGDADRAMDASIDLIGSIQSWLDSLAAADRHVQGVRIGAHYGPVVMSRLGGEHHQQITISGDTVNVASRLLDIASASGARIALSADLAAALSRRPPGSLSDGQPVAIRGRALPLTVMAWTPEPEPDPALPSRRAGP